MWRSAVVRACPAPPIDSTLIIPIGLIRSADDTVLTNDELLSIDMATV